MQDGAGQLKLDHENAALLAAGQQPTAERSLKPQRKPCGNRSRRCWTLQRALKISRTGSCSSTASRSRKAVVGSAICLPEGQSSSGRTASVTSSIRRLVLATLQANAERERTRRSSSQDTHRETDRHPVENDARARASAISVGSTKHNLKVMAQTVKLLQEKNLTRRGRPRTSASLNWKPSITTHWRW